MLNVIANGKQTIESAMNKAGRAVVELLLQLSATSIAPSLTFASRSESSRDCRLSSAKR